MYMPGRLRTASRPSRTVMELPEEAFSAGAAVFGRATTWGLPFAQPARGSPIHTGTRRCRTTLCLQRRRTTLGRLLAVSSSQDTGSTDRNAAVHALTSCLSPFGALCHHRCCPGDGHAVLGRLAPRQFIRPAREL